MRRRTERTRIEARERRGGGRPPKFQEPRRPVTVTLPERTLDALSSIDEDRACAIVKAVDLVRNGNRSNAKEVEIIPIDDDGALIVVGRSRSLARIPWLRQLEITPGRHLVSIEPGTPVDSLELALVDLLDENADLHDRRIIEELLTHVRRQRRDRSISKVEILVVRSTSAKRRRSLAADLHKLS